MTSWYVVHTHALSEARAAEHLRRQGYQAYVPQCRKWRSHARRRELVQRPLFPRYLFVFLDIMRTQWRPILSTVGVSTLLMRDGEPNPMPEGVVERIQGGEANGEFDRMLHRRFSPGEPVRILEGPFADLIGRFQGLADRERVYVLLELMERQVKVRLPADVLATV
jgi:transcriptional antiterminator RfaH